MNQHYIVNPKNNMLTNLTMLIISSPAIFCAGAILLLILLLFCFILPILFIFYRLGWILSEDSNKYKGE